MNRMLTQAPRRRGFTLIELLVALGISMALMIVIAEVFLQTRRGYSVQDDQARVQENTRYSVQTLSRALRQAGYRSNPGADSGYIFGASTPAVSGTDGGTTVSDQLVVRFQGSGTGAAADNTMFDCLGTAVDYGVIVTSTFAIRSGGADGNGLFCTNDATGASGWQEIVPGVENMQILYGQDTDGDANANVYGQIGSVNPLQIVSVRISLLLRSPTDTSQFKNANSYVLNGVTIPAANDSRVRRVVNFTTNLRNRTP